MQYIVENIEKILFSNCHSFGFGKEYIDEQT